MNGFTDGSRDRLIECVLHCLRSSLFRSFIKRVRRGIAYCSRTFMRIDGGRYEAVDDGKKRLTRRAQCARIIGGGENSSANESFRSAPPSQTH